MRQRKMKKAKLDGTEEEEKEEENQGLHILLTELLDILQ